MGTINAAWHHKHPMPKNPTKEQRIRWHVEHVKHCSCREMPESVRLLITARGGRGSALRKTPRTKQVKSGHPPR